MFDPLADHERATLEVHVGNGVIGSGEKQLTERRHGIAGECSEGGIIGGNFTPTEDGHALVFDDLVHTFAGTCNVSFALGEKCNSGGVCARSGQIEVDHGTEERIRYLDENAGAVTGVRLGAGGAPVLEVDQRGDGLLDNVSTTTTMHVHNECDTTGVVLVSRVVEALRARSVLHT